MPGESWLGGEKDAQSICVGHHRRVAECEKARLAFRGRRMGFLWEKVVLEGHSVGGTKGRDRGRRTFIYFHLRDGNNFCQRCVSGGGCALEH